MATPIDAPDRRGGNPYRRAVAVVGIGQLLSILALAVLAEVAAAAEIVAAPTGADPITFAVNSLKTFLATIATVVVAASIGWKAVVAWSAGSVEAQREAQRFAMQSLLVYGLVMAFNFGLLQSAVEYLVNTMGGRV